MTGAIERTESFCLRAQEICLFLAHWARAPHRIGAVAPSSQALALAMAKEIPPLNTSDAPVIELGGGTGSITKGLLESGIPPERLVIIERDSHLVDVLRQRFPNLRVILGDAGDLPELLARHGITRAAAVVSGLPLLLFPADLLRNVVDGCFQLLGNQGPLIQFTYGRVAPLPAKDFALEERRGARVWFNIPPATVWVFRKPASV